MTLLDDSRPDTVRTGARRPEPRPDCTRGRTEELVALRAAAQRGPGPGATEAQHRRGKLTVHERVELLLDEGSFREIERFRRHNASNFGMSENRPPGDGVVAGSGTIEGRPVFVYGHDFRVFGGSLGEAHAAKIHKIMDLAEAAGCPVISLCDGAGARIQEGVSALAGYGGIFQRNVRASGVIPQISVIMGPCAGGASYSPALTDFVFMVRGTAKMFITGPDVVEAVTGERVTSEELGGAEVHGRDSGVATFVYDDEVTCLEEVRHLVSILPANHHEPPPRVPTDDPVDRPSDALLRLVPADQKMPYDVRDVVVEVVDDGEYLELQEDWATNVVCALAHIDEHLVGIVANQPTTLAGALDIDASDKAARFVEICDSFGIPLVTLVDVPGFLPGVDQEHRGIIRHGAKLIHAYCAATVPRIQMILRKAYGGSYIVMDSRSIGADLSYAWPINEVAVMGAEGACNVVFRREIAEAPDPEIERELRIKEYRELLGHSYYAAEQGLVDDVIDPRHTRAVLAAALATMRAKAAPITPRKHSNRPV